MLSSQSPQYLATISSRQMDMQKFIAEGCKEAFLEEKRRFWFLAEKHCMFSYQLSNFHDKVSKGTSICTYVNYKDLYTLCNYNVSLCLHNGNTGY